MISARLAKRFPPGPDAAGFQLEVELEAHAGVTVLFGPSGAGKTLVLELIAGFSRPDSGRILLDDEILFDAEARVFRRPPERQCGYVQQRESLFPHMTLRENVAFAAERLARLERHRQVHEMIERFRLVESAGRRPHAVSGGERQRCAIARALITGPRALLLDEPARGLDAPLRAEFYSVLRQVRADYRIPILLVTHDLDECFALGDRMLVLRGGRIVQRGTPLEIVARPAGIEVARLLGLANLFRAEILALDPGRNTSRLRIGRLELTGQYLPGRLRGDEIWVMLDPGVLKVVPRSGPPAANQHLLKLLRRTGRPGGVRLEFEEGVVVDAVAPDLPDNENWLVEFPAGSIRTLA